MSWKLRIDQISVFKSLKKLRILFLKHPIWVKFQVGLESNRVFQKWFFQPFLMFKKRNLVSAQFPTHVSLLFLPKTAKSGIFFRFNSSKSVHQPRVVSISERPRPVVLKLMGF